NAGHRASARRHKEEGVMKRNLALLATAAALALSGLSAHAACVDPRIAVQNAANRMPPVLPAAAKAAAGSDHHDRDSIVGTWIVNYTSGGNPAGDAFIQWHDDGTEWENIDFPILGGTICLGDWRAIDENHVRRSHVGWLFENGNPSGYFTQTETDEVARDGSWYRGTNYIRLYDLNGAQFAEGAGTAEATRIPQP
ncbi:MAG TPA: hypothetical protein VK955_04190, partial [Xanthobacteraceae bacterium]|nr:hypothetical protein [Xanthobacteraceae bacterium]